MPGIFRTIYDPACGTGGMLSVSEEFILSQNARAELALYGQEYNDESWAICCSDMLIKDEDTKNIVLGDTLGDGKTRDGFEGSSFHYMLANPPFGVEWKDQKAVVEREHKEMGFAAQMSDEEDDDLSDDAKAAMLRDSLKRARHPQAPLPRPIARTR